MSSKHLEDAPPMLRSTLVKFFYDKALPYVLMGALAWSVTAFTNWWNKAELERGRVALEQATKRLKGREDYDAAFSLFRHVSQHKQELTLREKQVYERLLEHMESEVQFNKTLRLALDTYIRDLSLLAPKDTDPPEQAKSPAIENPKGDSSAAVLSALAKDALPLRLYVQIGKDAQHSTYKKIVDKLKSFDMVKVPAVELITEDRKLPKTSNLRYCQGSTSTELAVAMQQQLQPLVTPLNLYPLPANLCGGVRQNHIELWLAKEAQ